MGRRELEKYRPLREAVQAMELYDVLVWECPVSDHHTIRTKMIHWMRPDKCRSWAEGSKLIIVRVK